MLKQRIITALILAPIVLACLFLLDPEPFSYFVMFVVVLGAWEWANLSGIVSGLGRIVFAAAFAGILVFLNYSSASYMLYLAGIWWLLAVFLVLSFPKYKSAWSAIWAKALIGICVLVPLWQALVYVRTHSLVGHGDLSPLWIILYMLLLVWCADIGAYFAGKAWGKAKLAPRVSPGKSWAGAWGGLSTSVLLALMASYLLDENLKFALLLSVFSVVTGAISIIGDLTESMFKRERGIKDSSQLLPGHGGVLDRIDSLAAAVPVFTLILVLSGWLV